MEDREMDKKALPRIVIMYGGVGAEREISLISGKAVLDALKGYRGLPVIPVELKTDQLPKKINPATDIVLPVLHGQFGEDGAMQQELEDAGIVFCGSDARSSALCMNKARTKALLEENGVPVVAGLSCDKDLELSAGEIVSMLGPSIVAKPVGMGSSIGLQLLDGAEQIARFIREKDEQFGGWLLEQRIFGREFSVGILHGKAMGVVEIVVPEGRVYDYEQKYYRDDTDYQCPANIDLHVADELQHYAERAFAICGCRDYARVDFLWDQRTDCRSCLELNTIPGMTPTSLLPKSAGAVGLDFEGLLLKMMEPAIARFRERMTARNG